MWIRSWSGFNKRLKRCECRYYLGTRYVSKTFSIFQCGVISVKYEEVISWLVTYKRTQGFKIGCFPSILACQLTGETRIRSIVIVYALANPLYFLQFNFLCIWIRFYLQQHRCFELFDNGKSRGSLKKNTKKKMELIDYLMCGLAGLLVVLFIVGALAETCLKGLKTKTNKPPKGPFYILKIR